MIVAVIGSGGKTTLIHRTAQAYLDMGKKVFVTTTTHMYREEDTLVNPSLQEIEDAILEKHYCMAGMIRENGHPEKITALPTEMLCKIDKMVDIMLIEADGSRQMPLKWPAAYEPVIPECVDEIWLVAGLAGLGGRAEDVVHRYELAGFEPDHRITEEDLHHLLYDGYIKPLQKKFPQAGIQIFYIKVYLYI